MFVFMVMSKMSWPPLKIPHRKEHKNTNNAPLILKVCFVIFLSCQKHIMGHFWDFSRGPQPFLTPKLPFFYTLDNKWKKRFWSYRTIPRNGRLCVLPEKTNPPHSKHQRFITNENIYFKNYYNEQRKFMNDSYSI
jgi:hypothetical protein